ncbi:hypothetical protein NBRC116599_41290 [Aquicoccus sp. SU-CL01552]
MSRKAGFSGDRFHELAIIVPEVGGALEDLVPKQDPRPVSPLQHYVLARLDGAAGPAWLDGEGLEQSVRASEMLGVLMAYGTTPNLDKFTEDDWDHAGAVGFGYTSQGEAGIRQALSEVQQAFKYNGRNPGAQAVFGRLYQWLRNSKSRKDVGDIKRIVREHILDTMEVPTGGVVLGEKLLERRLYSCASLARATAVDPRTLRGMLIAKGLLPKDESQGAHHVFAAARGLEIARSMRRLVPVTKLPDALGSTRPLVDQLLSDRILTPIVSELSHAPGRTKKGVDTAEISRLLDRIQSAASPAGKPRESMVDLATAAMKSNAPAVEIVHLILGGFLSNVVRLDGKAGFEGIRVDPAETKSLVSEVMVGLSPAEAFARIRVPVLSGWELVEDSVLRTIEIYPKRGDHVIHRFRPDDIDAFLAEFTTEAWIGNALRMSLDALKLEMKAARVKPFLRKSDIGIRIFRRRDLPARYQV